MSLNEQVAQIIQIITKLQKQEDFHTTKNIVADKTIYAKRGLHVGDFNPAFDLFIKGNSCIKGDLIIKGFPVRYTFCGPYALNCNNPPVILYNMTYFLYLEKID